MVTTISRELAATLQKAAELVPQAFEEESLSVETFFREVGKVLKPVVKYINGPIKKSWWGPNGQAFAEDHRVEYFDFRGVVVAENLFCEQHNCATKENGHLLVFTRKGEWVLLEHHESGDAYQSGGYDGENILLEWNPLEALETLREMMIIEGVVNLLDKEAENRRKRLAAIEARKAAMEAALAAYASRE